MFGFSNALKFVMLPITINLWFQARSSMENMLPLNNSDLHDKWKLSLVRLLKTRLCVHNKIKIVFSY